MDAAGHDADEEDELGSDIDHEHARRASRKLDSRNGARSNSHSSVRRSSHLPRSVSGRFSTHEGSQKSSSIVQAPQDGRGKASGLGVQRDLAFQSQRDPEYRQNEEMMNEYHFNRDRDRRAENDDDIDDLETSSISSSSVSSSSIIDLPPPMLPARIIPPASLSISRGLDVLASAGGITIGSGIAAGNENDLNTSPIMGLVRRTRSARFLGRSWGSRHSGLDLGGHNDDRAGYGTFGR